MNNDPKEKAAPQDKTPIDPDEQLTMDDVRELFRKEKERTERQDIEDFELDIL